MYYLQNEQTKIYAGNRSSGEHDVGNGTSTLEYARQFPSWKSASEFSQNFGSDWFVVEA